MIVVLSLIISYILPYHYYPYVDRKQKLKKLKSLQIEPYTKKEIGPTLHKYTQGTQDIKETVFDFTNIDSQSMNTILDSEIQRQPLYRHFISNIY